jgi:hypothetical protein
MSWTQKKNLNCAIFSQKLPIYGVNLSTLSITGKVLGANGNEKFNYKHLLTK